mgnify:FL=1
MEVLSDGLIEFGLIFSVGISGGLVKLLGKFWMRVLGVRIESVWS